MEKTYEEMKLALEQAVKLLHDAKDIFDGELSLCDEVNSDEWYWRWRVRYYFAETDIPVHDIREAQ